MEGTLESGKPGLEGMKYRVAMQLVSDGGEATVSPKKASACRTGRKLGWYSLLLPPMLPQVPTSPASAMRKSATVSSVLSPPLLILHSPFSTLNSPSMSLPTVLFMTVFP